MFSVEFALAWTSCHLAYVSKSLKNSFLRSVKVPFHIFFVCVHFHFKGLDFWFETFASANTCFGKSYSRGCWVTVFIRSVLCLCFGRNFLRWNALILLFCFSQQLWWDTSALSCFFPDVWFFCALSNSRKQRCGLFRQWHALLFRWWMQFSAEIFVSFLLLRKTTRYYFPAL